MEIWENMKGFEGFYQVSNEGKGKSLDRVVEMNNKWGTKTKVVKKGKLLTPHYYPNGYLFFTLTVNGKKYQEPVHRAVAKAFIPNPQNLPEVNHKDEDKSNNCVENLEWCTHQYNNTYNNKHLKVGNKLLNRTDCSKIVYKYKNGTLVEEYPSASEAARQNNVCVSNIVQCCNGGFYLHNKWVNKNSIKGFNYSYS